jgi:hypothetical protein
MGRHGVEQERRDRANTRWPCLCAYPLYRSERDGHAGVMDNPRRGARMVGWKSDRLVHRSAGTGRHTRDAEILPRSCPAPARGPHVTISGARRARSRAAYWVGVGIGQRPASVGVG